jgi:hypothetical protein
MTDAEWDRFNLAGFTCASKYAVDDRLAYAVPAWQSRYFGDWDSQHLYDDSGAYHGSDIPMLFGSGEEVTGIPNSELQEKYSNYMGATWVAFASDPRHGLEKQGWPAFDASSKFSVYRDLGVDANNLLVEPKRTIVGLGFKNGTLAKFLDPTDVEKGCAALHGSSLPGKGGF